MTEAPQEKPFYSAIILRQKGEDLGPFQVANARDESEAVKIATELAGKWMIATGVNDASVQVMEDGRALAPRKLAFANYTKGSKGERRPAASSATHS